MRYMYEKIDDVYYFSHRIHVELDLEPWDVESVNQMADVNIFLRTALLYNSKDAIDVICYEMVRGATFMVVSIEDEIIYKGLPGYDVWLKVVLDFYDKKMKEQELEDGLYYMKPSFKEDVLKYLHLAKVLVSTDSDMEEILFQRDSYYGEEDVVDFCIKGIEKLL